jgi:hypothetical protein
MGQENIIGSARMDSEGTIFLQLRATTTAGSVGDALIIYKRDDPNYVFIREHLKDLRPGNEVEVPAFPSAQK